MIDSRRTVRVVSVVIAMGLVACGGSAAKTPSSTPEAKDGVVRPITQAQLPVAHYATGDGNVGFVLDRTKEPARLRMDGSQDVVELTPVEDRRSGERRGFFYKAPDGKNLLYISVGGGIDLFTEHDRFHVTSDREAKPLPAPSVSGQWSETKTPVELLAEKLAARSVVRTSSMKADDSMDLGKIASAVSSAPKEAFVRLTAKAAKDAAWTPVQTSSYRAGYQGDTWDPARSKGYAKYGGRLASTLVQMNAPNRLHTESLRGWPAPLAAGTPALLWEVDGRHVTLVTLDGGRYLLWLPDDADHLFEDDPGKATAWPAPLQHALVSVSDTHELGKLGVLDAPTAEQLDALDDGWFECMRSQWQTAQKAIDDVERSHADLQQKWGKASGIARGAELDAPKKCAPAKKALEDGLVKAIEARNAARTAIWEKAQARFR